MRFAAARNSLYQSTRREIMPNRNTTAKLVLAACALVLSSLASAQDAIHAVSGAVSHLDKEAKTITIKTADGAEQVFHYTEHTSIRDSSAAATHVKMGAVDTYFAGKEGSKVVVRYLGKGADKTTTLVEDFGKDSLKAGRGTVTHVDKATHTVAIRTEDGAISTYQMSDRAVVETDHGVVRGSRYLIKEGDRVTVHYTEDASGKIIRFFKKL
jgi:hypothetical protein